MSTNDSKHEKPCNIDIVKGSLFEGIEMPTIKAEYYIGVDTYDSDALAYSLARKVGKTTEILLCKSMPEKNEFTQEVENLARYFNATVIGT